MPTSMGDEDSGMPTLGSVTKKKINELRVVDLRTELERRGLDKNGIKAILIERLSEALKNEGHTAEEYLFEVDDSSVKKKKGAGKAEDSMESQDGEHELTLDMNEMMEFEEGDDKTEHKDSDYKKEIESSSFQCKDDGDSNISSRTGTASTSSSPPRPESMPVLAPLTVSDTLTMHPTEGRRNADIDDASMIVNLDEQSLREEPISSKDDDDEDDDMEEDKKRKTKGETTTTAATNEERKAPPSDQEDSRRPSEKKTEGAASSTPSTPSGAESKKPNVTIATTATTPTATAAGKGESRRYGRLTTPSHPQKM